MWCRGNPLSSYGNCIIPHGSFLKGFQIVTLHSVKTYTGITKKEEKCEGLDRLWIMSSHRFMNIQVMNSQNVILRPIMQS
ncbi:hypothetical protein GDO78_017470 [Eleutherodactylus coqui]|uniref:Uncharacterized protein n=1 Tax=Eleutherodactylus coqui TaxID=57060 RepID=A0A8J6E7G6_ELECQ|nr:hypothetical protein GDO78_017470 [Eleutherodactylus coqui]